MGKVLQKLRSVDFYKKIPRLVKACSSSFISSMSYVRSNKIQHVPHGNGKDGAMEKMVVLNGVINEEPLDLPLGVDEIRAEKIGVQYRFWGFLRVLFLNRIEVFIVAVI